MGVKKNLLKSFAKKIFWKFFFSQSEHVSSQIRCQKFFPLLRRVPPPPPEKLLRISWNKFWFWNFWDLMISRGGSLSEIQTYVQTDTRHSDQISYSARRDSATKKKKDQLHSEVSLPHIILHRVRVKRLFTVVTERGQCSSDKAELWF